ncbi:MAG: S8 family serine peptidase, partial [Dokdonella sp.]
SFQVAHAADVAPGLRAKAQQAGSVDTLIILSAQAPKQLLRPDGDYLERRRALVGMLRATADLSQSGLRHWLEANHIAYRSFWINNMIQARLSAGQIDELAARTDIARVAANPVVRMQPPQSESTPENTPSPDAPDPGAWGLNKINAPAVWALGDTGQGIVIAGQDTGIRWTHNALKPHYRGWNGTTADHNYNWHDSIHSGGGICGANTVAPCDDQGHGSHTVGTMLGEDASGLDYGVAPGAKFIGCRNMNVGDGTPATYNECAQWLLAPTDLAGNNPDPAKAPDIVSNSWGCPTTEGCTTGGSEVKAAIDNLVAGGIFFVAAAGNGGSGCGGIISQPATLESAFAVGSTEIGDTMSSFSLRGPVTGANRVKPDVVAPGGSIKSVSNGSDTATATLSGTSMATPHVAGAAALIMAANPTLKGNPAAVADILRATTVHISSTQVCGGIPATTFPNPVQGYGRIDVLAAYMAVAPIMKNGFD